MIAELLADAVAVAILVSWFRSDLRKRWIRALSDRVERLLP